jgi:hypothetical protein
MTHSEWTVELFMPGHLKSLREQLKQQRPPEFTVSVSAKEKPFAMEISRLPPHKNAKLRKI